MNSLITTMCLCLTCVMSDLHFQAKDMYQTGPCLCPNLYIFFKLPNHPLANVRCAVCRTYSKNYNKDIIHEFKIYKDCKSVPFLKNHVSVCPYRVVSILRVHKA